MKGEAQESGSVRVRTGYGRGWSITKSDTRKKMKIDAKKDANIEKKTQRLKRGKNGFIFIKLAYLHNEGLRGH